MKKQLLLLFIMLLPMVVDAHDIEVKNADDITIYYNFINDGNELAVTFCGDYYYSYYEYTGNVVIPDKVTYMNRTRKVTSIGNDAFRDCFGLTSITIPNSVTSIGNQAFEYCNSLTSVIIPEGVTSIEKNAFSKCTGLTSVTINSNSIVSKNYSSNSNIRTFFGNQVKNYILGNGVTSIGSSAFSGCTGMTSVTIPEAVTSIGDYAFSGCTGLTSVTIPEGVPDIGRGTFSNCTALTSVTINSNSIVSKNYVSYSNIRTFFGNQVKNYILGNGVTSIGFSAFSGCTGMTSVTIPETVTSIGDYAFSGCTGLTSVTIPEGVPDIGRGTFSNCTALTSVTINSNSIVSKNYSYDSNIRTIFGEQVQNYFIGDVVTSIGKYAFYSCTELTSVTIPSFVTSIGNFAFADCAGLTSVTIPSCVNNIGDYAFAYCKGLTSVIIPEGVTNIGSHAFYSCAKLTSVTIGSSVTSISDCAFDGVNIPTVISLIENPFTINGITTRYHTFSASTFENATLFVPMGTIDKYKAKEGWKDFSFIEEVDFAGTYKLTYLVDGEAIKSYDLKFGENITPEPVPTKEGYTFSGWSEIPETMPAHDVTITGTFSANKYKLTYKIDGEIYKTFDVEYGATITPETAPSKEGHTFSGWSEIPETMPAHDVTVTGTFTVNKYKLTYMVDGELYKTYDVEFGTTITPESYPTKENYTFSGWSEIPATMPAHDVTVTGTFAINSYKLTYKVDGEVYKTYNVEFGATITPEEEPTKEGYTFSGWSEIPETMPAYDVTVTGAFSVNSYKLTYMIDNKVYKETIYEYGASIIPEPQPEGDYATFEWTDLPQTMPAHDVVVHASYTTGIEVLMATQRNIRIYSPNGKILKKLQKGLNIVVLDDSTVKKVVMK